MSDRGSSPVDKDARIAELEVDLVARDTLIDTLRFQLAFPTGPVPAATFGQSKDIGAGGGTRTPTGRARRIFLPATAFTAARQIACAGVCGLDYPFTMPRQIGG